MEEAMRIIRDRSLTRAPEQATVAQASFSDSAGLGAVSDFEARGIPVFGPRGRSYRPLEGDRLLIMRADGADVCVGCLSAARGVAAGELLLVSSGGARIHLKNNGDIELNGLTVTKNGSLRQTGGA
jgi:hypothetical protein